MKLSFFGYQHVFVYDILFLSDSVNKNLWYLFNIKCCYILLAFIHWKYQTWRVTCSCSHIVGAWWDSCWTTSRSLFFSTNDSIRWGIIRNMIARIRTPFIYSTFQQFLPFLQWCLYNTLDYVWTCSSTLNAIKMGKW